MNELQIFDNPEFGQLRRVEIQGEFWLVGKDVALSLGYKDTVNAIKAHVDAEDKGVWQIATPSGTQDMTIINESGVYSLIFSSKLPDAKKFKKWVTSEVLPTVRKTGTYSTQQLTPAQLIAAQAQVLVDMEQKMLAIQNQAQAIQAQQDALSNKVDTALKAFSRPAEDHWKADVDQAIKDLCKEHGYGEPKARRKMYRELEEKCGCDIDRRLLMLRKRVKKQGMRHRDAMALNKLDAIAADKQLRAAFEGIVREWQARSVVVEGQQEIKAVQDSFDLAEAL